MKYSEAQKQLAVLSQKVGHITRKNPSDVSDFYFYAFDFAVLMEDISNFLILPQSFFKVLYCSSDMISVFTNKLSQYSVS